MIWRNLKGVFDKLYPGTVTCYPTLLVIDPVTGNIIHKWTGVKQADELIGEAKKALSNRGIVAMDERFREGERDFDFIREYVNTLSQASDRRERVTEVLDIYFKETNCLGRYSETRNMGNGVSLSLGH